MNIDQQGAPAIFAGQGLHIQECKGHDKVSLGNRMTVLSRHGTDIGPYLFNRILKDLGIEKGKA